MAATARRYPSPSDVLPVSDRRNLILERLHQEGDWLRAARLIAFMERLGHWSRHQGAADLRNLVKAARIERRIEGTGEDASVWYRAAVTP